jgi:hypothetical protein
MKDISRMDVLQAAKDLIDERLEMGICKWLTGTNDGGKIAFHEFYRVIRPFLRIELAGYCPPSYKYVSLKFSGRGMSIS